jgi:hypothetical protein
VLLSRWRLSQRYCNRLFRIPTIESNLYLLTHLVRLQNTCHLLCAANIVTVYRGDNVARLDACFIRRTAGSNISDKRPFVYRQPKPVNCILVNRIKSCPLIGTYDVTILNQLVYHWFRCFDAYGVTHALDTHLGYLDAVDANYFP